ncbi:leucine rich repeat domain protein [Perkinsela sp. CCAP 1560/4]|nr:leucine rich repeat domain protein [Perkinsela sp. CCAP 1560/4]|eukprot:KNH03891.1 leucine rich repeat domain protein [Perkinsela sp. CCAP 1560/4]
MTYNADQCSNPLLLQHLVAKRRFACMWNINYTHNRYFSYNVSVRMNALREKYRLRSQFWFSQRKIEENGLTVIPGSVGVDVSHNAQEHIFFFNFDQIIHGRQMLLQNATEAVSFHSGKLDLDAMQGDDLW